MRINIGFRWPILTVSTTELMDVIFSCVLLYLTMDYVSCVFLHTELPPRSHENPASPKRQALIGPVRAYSCRFPSHEWRCLATTGPIAIMSRIACQT